MANNSNSSNTNWTLIAIVGISIAGLYFLSQEKASYSPSGAPLTIGSGIAQGTTNAMGYAGAGVGVGAAAVGIGKSGILPQIGSGLSVVAKAIGNGIKNIFSGGSGPTSGIDAGAESIGNDVSSVL